MPHPPPPQTDRENAPAVTLGRYRHFFIGAVVYLAFMQCVVLLSAIPSALAGRADFRNLYAAGYLVRAGAGHQLYDFHLQEQAQNRVTPPIGFMPYVYPAFTALLFAPLTLLGFRAAYAVFFAFNLLLLWIAARFTRDALPRLSSLWPPLPLALFFCFLPCAVTLMQGQTSILLLALFSASFYSMRKQKPLLAGVLLGLATMKIQLVLPFVMLLAIWRRWRVFVGFVLGTMAVMAIFACVTGLPEFVNYWRWIFQVASSAPGKAAAIPMPPRMMPNLYGLAQDLAGGAAWGARLHAVAALLLFLWIAFRPEFLPLALVGSVLITRYSGIHDLAVVVLPIVLILERAATTPFEPRVRTATLVSLVLLLPPLYLTLLGQFHVDWLAIPLLVFCFCLLRLPRVEHDFERHLVERAP